MVAQLVSGRQFAKVHFASKELPRNVHTTQVVKEQRTVVVGTTNSLKTESSLADRNSKPSTTGKIVGHTVETVFYKEANDCPEQTIVRSIPVMEYPNIGNANPEMGSYNEKVTNWSGYLSNTRTFARRILEEAEDYKDQQGKGTHTRL